MPQHSTIVLGLVLILHVNGVPAAEPRPAHPGKAAKWESARRC